MPAMAARSKIPTPAPIPAMAPVPIVFLAGVDVNWVRLITEVGFWLAVEVESAVKTVGVVKERLVGVIDGSAEDGPTVLPIAV